MTETKTAGPNEDTQVFDRIEVLAACGLPVSDSDLLKLIAREYSFEKIEGASNAKDLKEQYKRAKELALGLKEQGAILIPIKNGQYILVLDRLKRLYSREIGVD